MAFLIAQAASVLGFRRAVAEAWYPAHRPTLTEPSTWYYIDASGGNDANPGTEGSPFQTLLKAQGTHLGGGRVGAPGVGFYLKGTFTDQGIIPALGCTANAWAVFKPWPGFTATVDANNTGSYDPYPVWVAGRPYVWVEGITLDGAGASYRYAVYAAPDGATYTTNLVLKDCTITGEVVLVGASDCWIEGNTQDRAGSNGLIMGPTAVCATAALAGLGAGNVNAGAHSYLVQFTVENSPSSTEGTTEYSLVGTHGSDVAQRSNAVTTTGGDGQVALTGIAVSPNPYCTARRIFRTSANADPTVYANYKLLTTIANNTTTTFADNVADGSLGAVLDSSGFGSGNTGDSISLVCDAVSGCHRTVVYNNDIGHAGHIAIAVGFSGAVTPHEDVRIAFNRVSNTWAGGIATAYCTNILVEGNDVLGTASNYLIEPRWVQTTDGIILNGDDGICRYNRVRDGYGPAIAVYGNNQGAVQHSRRGTIVFNTCVENDGHGLLVYGFDLGDVKDNLIENNIFWGNCRTGMTSQLAAHGYYGGAVYDVWVYVTSVDASLIAGWWDGANKALNGNVIRDNTISTSPEALLWVGGARGGTQALTKTQAENDFGTAYLRNTSIDPLFLSTAAASSDFCRISLSSPAKDAGLAIVGYAYAGAAPDRGVYEVG